MFLLGEMGFPPDIAVVVTGCLDTASRLLIYAPFLNDLTAPVSYTMLMFGIYLRVFLGPDDNLRRLVCCIHAKHKPIFVEDCSKQSLAAFETLQEDAKIATNVQGTSYANRSQKTDDIAD